MLDAKDLEVIKTEVSATVIKWLWGELQQLPAWNEEALKSLISSGTSVLNLKGKLYYTPLNIALSYKSSCPETHSVLLILGKEEALRRLQKALDIIKVEAQ
jgi:nondiscriminating glutamyl-tRNA synthetase